MFFFDVGSLFRALCFSLLDCSFLVFFSMLYMTMKTTAVAMAP